MGGCRLRLAPKVQDRLTVTPADEGNETPTSAIEVSVGPDMNPVFCMPRIKSISRPCPPLFVALALEHRNTVMLKQDGANSDLI